MSSVTAAPEHVPNTDGPPFASASAAQIRGVLTPEDAASFEQQWRAAMRAATDSLDLAEVHAVLDAWRPLARLMAARGESGYRSILARAAETLRTREEPPGTASLEEIRLLIAQRLA